MAVLMSFIRTGMKVTELQRKGLIRDILTGTIQRGRYPELFSPSLFHHIGLEGATREEQPQPPVEVPKADRRRLAGAILKGEVDPGAFPAIWPPVENGGIKIILPVS